MASESRRELQHALLKMGIHTIGTATTASLIALVLMPGLGSNVVAASLAPGLHGAGIMGLAAHLALSAAIWAILYFTVAAIRSRRRTPRHRISPGFAMVETLIVLPAFLLLTSGLAQLTLLNVAGLLSNLAAYNAGRAVWVWDAQGVSDGECQQRAIDGAAHAVAPSVPNDFVGASGTRAGDAKSLQFAAAFDLGSVPDRAPGKLAFAKQSVRIRVIRESDEVGAEMVYLFHIAFPWFNHIFGVPDQVGRRVGYFSPIRRTYTLPRQPS